MHSGQMFSVRSRTRTEQNVPSCRTRSNPRRCAWCQQSDLTFASTRHSCWHERTHGKNTGRVKLSQSSAASQKERMRLARKISKTHIPLRPGNSLPFISLMAASASFSSANAARFNQIIEDYEIKAKLFESNGQGIHREKACMHCFEIKNKKH